MRQAMFTTIFNWMLSHVPGFMRPGVSWLLDGLRRITSHISSRWNALGAKVSRWVWRVAYFKDRAVGFARAVADIVAWLKAVYVPRVIHTAVTGILRAVNVALNRLERLALAGIASLRRWAETALSVVRRLLDAVRGYAVEWINRIRASVMALIQGLRHVLNGPAALAEWLVASMAKALGRYLFAQRERFLSWLLRESVTWTRWLAREVETLLLRWL